MMARSSLIQRKPRWVGSWRNWAKDLSPAPQERSLICSSLILPRRSCLPRVIRLRLWGPPSIRIWPLPDARQDAIEIEGIFKLQADHYAVGVEYVGNSVAFV